MTRGIRRQGNSYNPNAGLQRKVLDSQMSTSSVVDSRPMVEYLISASSAREIPRIVGILLNDPSQDFGGILAACDAMCHESKFRHKKMIILRLRRSIEDGLMNPR